jgi:hypothetical protein
VDRTGRRCAPVAPGLSDLVEHVFVLDVRRATQPSWMILPDYSEHMLVRIGRGLRGLRATASSVMIERTGRRPDDVDRARLRPRRA